MDDKDPRWMAPCLVERQQSPALAHLAADLEKQDTLWHSTHEKLPVLAPEQR